MNIFQIIYIDVIIIIQISLPTIRKTQVQRIYDKTDRHFQERDNLNKYTTQPRH